MKLTKTFALLGALASAMTLGASAQTSSDPQGADGFRPGGPRRGPPPELLEKYDVNKDGKLDDSERAALRQDIESGKIQPPGPRGPRGPGGGPAGPPAELLEKYDVNKDGKLDATEHEAIRKDIEAGKLQPPPHRRMGPPPEIVEKYDVNKDGTLDESEREALHKDIQDGKVQPPPGRRGHGAPPPPENE